MDSVELQFKTVPLELIDETPLFPISFARDLASLKNSIESSGVLNPLCLYRVDNCLKILDGLSRFMIAKEFNLPQLPAYIYFVDSINLAQAFYMTVEYNLWAREFNLVEKGLIYKFVGNLSTPGLKKAIDKLLGIRDEKESKDFTKLLELPLPIQHYLVEKNIPLKVAQLFLKWNSAESLIIFNVIKSYPINQNFLKEILELLFEVGKRDEIKVVDILNKVISSRNSTNYDLEQLKKNLLLLRYPRYQQQENEFKENLKKLNLQEGIQVAKSPSSDNDFMEVKFRLSSDGQRQKIIEELKKEGWKKLF